MNYNRSLFILLPVMLLLFSCEKEQLPADKSSERSVDQMAKDSVYYYYNQYSLWSDAATIEQSAVAAFTYAYDSPTAVLDALKSRTPAHAAYNGGIDRFSHLENNGSTGLLASTSGTTNAGFGFFLSIGAVSDTMAYPVVYFVEGGSPADAAGIRRSDVVLNMGAGQDLGIPISCASGSCKVIDESLQQVVINKLLTAMENNRMQIRLRHSDDSESTASISAQAYDVNPVIKERVFTYPAKHIGYLALSSFEDVAEGQVNRYRLDEVFANFEGTGINDLILDLRYNTGGYISSAEYLANKVIGPAADKSLMYKFGLNAYLSQPVNWKGQSFDDVHFRRNNNLNLNTVYFLVTDITASASELLINVLRPYMNVVIIAEHDGTYGKPVGFFKQEIMGKTALWAASFKLINSRGESDYWDGIKADQKNVVDYIFSDFGDPQESMLSTALMLAAGRVNAGPILAKTQQMAVPKKQKARMDQVNAIPQKDMFKN